MNKLFLTSLKLDKLLEMLPKKSSELKVAFIPTAADNYQDKSFVDKDWDWFQEKGFKLTKVDLKNKKESDLNSELGDVDIIFVSGGNTFYLLEKVKESGFDKLLPALLEKGIIYAGASAGAIITGPSIEPVDTLDDPSEAVDLQSFDGLNLVDFVILPHYGKPKYEDKYQKILRKYKEAQFEIKTLTDEQAIVVEGDSYKTV